LLPTGDVGLGGQISRRGFVRGMAAGAAVVGGGVALSACGALGSTASTTTQKPKILLLLRPWIMGGTNPQTASTLLYQATEPWRAQHPGVDIKIVTNLPGPPQLIAELLTGTAPDVYHSWHPDALFSQSDYTTDLTPYIKESHADLSVFNQAQMTLFRQPSGILALPAYLGILTLAVNLGLIDNLGLERPTTGWTYKDYATLCRQIRASTGTKAVGGGFGLGFTGSPSPYLPPECLLQGFGGSYVQSGNNSVCTMDSTQVITAMNWAYGLAQEGAVSNPSLGGSLHEGTIGMQMAFTWNLIYYALNWDGVNWAFHETPMFPEINAPVCSCTSDFYALNPRSKHLDLAWSLLYWMTFETSWQRSMMKLFLLSPALTSLWDEWVSKVANRNLQAFATLAQGGHAYPEPFMLYQADTAYNYMNSWGEQMWNQGVSIPQGLQQMTHQINELELVGAKEAGVSNKLQSAISSTTPGPTSNYPAPSVTGVGTASTTTPYVLAHNGAYTLLGDGDNIGGPSGSNDACVFAAASTTATEATWTCQLRSLANVSEASGGEPVVANWVRAGLMARGDLSDNAPMVLLSLSGYYGFDFMVRPSPLAAVQEQKYIFWKGSQGVYTPLVSALTSPASNYLIKPVWLRLTRKGTNWTPYASIDGTTFTQLGPSIEANLLAGAWVGVAVNAYNTEFNDTGYVRATFDHLTSARLSAASGGTPLTPTKFVQIGTKGIPPKAGTVPSNWATGNFA
jgi:hypothetical protein